MLESIQVRTQQLQKLYQHAEVCFPQESVALLFGNVLHNSVIVKRIELVENTLDSTTSFAIDPMIQYQLLMKADEREEELVAIFHSHPGSTSPSKRDRENMQFNPVVWVIASKEAGSWNSQAFFLLNGKMIDIEMAIV